MMDANDEALPPGALEADRNVFLKRGELLLLGHALRSGFSDSGKAGTARLCGKNIRLRHLAIYLSHVSFGLSQRRVARLFGRDRSTVRYVCARVEDLRDNARVDRMLDAIAAGLCAFRCAFCLERGGRR